MEKQGLYSHGKSGGQVSFSARSGKVKEYERKSGKSAMVRGKIAHL